MIPAQLIVASLLGWLQREQSQAIAYLREENRILKAQLRNQRLRLTDDERRRLASIGARLGRRLLTQVATIVTPDTILRWCAVSSLRGNGHIQTVGQDDLVSSVRFVVWSCEWRPRIPRGVTRAFKAR